MIYSLKFVSTALVHYISRQFQIFGVSTFHVFFDAQIENAHKNRWMETRLYCREHSNFQTKLSSFIFVLVVDGCKFKDLKSLSFDRRHIFFFIINFKTIFLVFTQE